MCEVGITTANGTTTLSAPYHPDLPSKAKALGGKFDGSSKDWHFDARDEERVRELAREVYGTDGSDAGDTVTVRIEVSEDHTWSERNQGLFLGGRQIARAYGRDSGATLADGVIVLGGEIDSGGSAKNWSTVAREGTVIEVRDVPRGVAEKMVEEAPNVTTRMQPVLTARIDESEDDHRAALQAERERLMARVAEIDAELGK